MLRILFILIGILLVIVLVFVTVVVLNQGVSRPIRYELPPGYRGWVEVYYQDPTCQPMRTKGIYLVITISSSGRGCTSGIASKGWTYHRPEYVHSDGKRVSAPFHHISYNEEKNRDLIFIGTEEELKKNWGTAPWR